MGNIKNKWFPFEWFDIENAQSWFEDCEKKGLKLKDRFGRIIGFEKTEPRECRYRIDVIGGRGEYGPDTSVTDLYAECGWEYVLTLMNTYHVYRCYDPEVPELHTDPVLQAKSMKKMHIKNMIFEIVEVLFVIVFLGMLISEFMSSEIPLRETIETGSVRFFSLVTMLLLLLPVGIIQMHIRSSIYHRLKRGEKLKSKKRYIGAAVTSTLSLLLLIALLLTYWISGFATIANSSSHMLANYKGELDVICLEHIEYGETRRLSEMEPDDFKCGNFMKTDSDVLAPEMLILYEYGEDMYLHIEYYKMRYRSLASRMAHELMFPKDDHDITAPFELINVEGADEAYLSEEYTVGNEIRRELIIRCGSRVVSVIHSGDAELIDWADEYAAMLLNAKD